MVSNCFRVCLNCGHRQCFGYLLELCGVSNHADGNYAGMTIPGGVDTTVQNAPFGWHSKGAAGWFQLAETGL